MRRLPAAGEDAGEEVVVARGEVEVEAKVLLQVVIVGRVVQLVVLRRERVVVSLRLRKATRPRLFNNDSSSSNRAKSNKVVGGEATIDVVEAEVVRQKSHNRSEASIDLLWPTNSIIAFVCRFINEGFLRGTLCIFLDAESREHLFSI